MTAPLPPVPGPERRTELTATATADLGKPEKARARGAPLEISNLNMLQTEG